jgi:hypothetical protein
MSHEKKNFNPSSVNSDKNKYIYKQFFENFYIFNTHFETVANHVCNLADLHLYIIQPNIADKKDRHWITPNFHINHCKTKETATPSNFVLLDVDLKTPAQLAYAQKTVGGTTLQQTLTIMMNLVGSMKECMFLDESTSGKGFHAIFHVVSDYWQENINQKIEESYLQEIKRQNFNCVFTKLKTLGFDMCNSKLDDYIDPAMDKITQGLYSSNGNAFYINPDADLFAYIFDRSKLPTQDDLNLKKTNGIASGQTLSINDDYTNLMMEYRLSISGDTDLKDEYRILIKGEMAHYNIGILHSVKHCNNDSIDYWADIYKNWYEGGSVPRTKTQFLKFIGKANLPVVVPLAVLLPKLSKVLYRYKEAKMAKLPPSIYDGDIIPFKVLNLTEYDIRKKNDWYMLDIKKYISKNGKKEIFKDFEKDFYYWFINPSMELLYSLKLSNAWVVKVYYKHIKKHNTNKELSKHLTDYNTFWYYIQTIDAEFKLPLFYLFRNVDLHGRDYYTKDSLDVSYDESIRYKNGHITSDKTAVDRLLQLIREHKFIALKGTAGAGKSTFIYMYLNELLKVQTNINIVIVSPINGLLMQMINSIRKKYPHIRLHLNYGKHRVDNKRLKNGCNLICSSTPKLPLIDKIDLIIIDEVDKLENYGDTIFSNFDRDIPLIVTSATIESWLIYERNFYYVNLMAEDFARPKLNIIYTDDFDSTLYRLFDPKRRQLIYENNNDMLDKRKIYIKEKFGVDTDVVYSKKSNDDDVVKILDDEKLNKSTLSSNWIGAGINLNDPDDCDIIILDHNFRFSEIYQMSQRFRVAKNVNIYLLHKYMRTYEMYDDFTFFNKELYNYGEYLKQYELWTEHLDKINLVYDSEKYKNSRSYKNLIKTGVYVEDIYGELVLNDDALKNQAYKRTIFEPYSKDKRVFERALSYSFKLNITEESHKEKSEKYNAKERTDWFMINHQDVITVFGSKGDFNEDLFGNKIINDDIFFKNMAYYRKLYDRCMDINRLKLDPIEVKKKEVIRDYNWYLAEVVQMDMHYNRFIKRLRSEVVNNIKDRESIDDKIVLKYYDKRGEFFRYLNTKGVFRKNKGEITLPIDTAYLLVDDAVKAIKEDIDKDPLFMQKNFYDVEINSNWFSVDDRSVGVFLSSMGSFLTQQNKKIKTGNMIPVDKLEYVDDENGNPIEKIVTKMVTESVQTRFYVVN